MAEYMASYYPYWMKIVYKSNSLFFINILSKIIYIFTFGKPKQ